MLRTLLVVALVLSVACGGSETAPVPTTEPVVAPVPTPAPVATAEPASVTLDLIVSDETRDLIVPLSEPRYAEARLPEVFGTLRSLGDPYCAMIDGDEPMNRATAGKFLRDKHFTWYSNACRGCKSNVRLGCWNFFKMNDRHPEDDLELVGKLWPEPSYDCYAVGMVQPYMMHNILNCSSLSMLDFDWRIHDAHHQLLQRYRAGKVTDSAALEAELKGITIGWIAQTDDPRPSHPASLGAFCTGKQRDLCEKHLVAFQGHFDAVRQLQLDLAALHEASFLSTDTTKVVFLSNAIEEIYTTKPEFEQLMARLDAALRPGQRAILIHHVGAYRAFGLYEMVKKDVGYDLTTRCRDTYTATATNRTSTTYDTWLEGVSTTRGAVPKCRALYEDEVGPTRD